MQKIPTTSPLRRAARSVIWAALAASSSALLLAGGCSAEDLTPISAQGAVAGTGITPIAGTSPGVAGSASGGGGSGGSAAMSGGIGGIAPVAGTSSSGGGGGSSGGASGGAGGAAPKPCVDTPAPPRSDWPDATCEDWATQTSECTASWFASYCDISCGRCKPEGGGGSDGGGGGPAAVDCSTMNLPTVSGGNGYATRYWDCCQPHCSQFDGHRCNQDGTTRTGNTQSSCSGGGSYACYDEAPKAVNDCLSYGYVAKANPNCGQCYRIQFTGEGQYNAKDPGSMAIKGKQMILKVSNTGGDVASNQFDMMIPGGGVGQFNACAKQWGSSDLGAQYGGFLTNCSGSYSAKKDCVKQNCMKIPAGAARDGCLWFVDWFQAADNPKFTSQQTDCPF
jgi:hypothetical protein